MRIVLRQRELFATIVMAISYWLIWANFWFLSIAGNYPTNLAYRSNSGTHLASEPNALLRPPLRPPGFPVKGVHFAFFFNIFFFLCFFSHGF